MKRQRDNASRVLWHAVAAARNMLDALTYITMHRATVGNVPEARFFQRFESYRIKGVRRRKENICFKLMLG